MRRLSNAMSDEGKRAVTIVIALVAALAVIAVLSLFIGSGGFKPASEKFALILWQLRLPRVLLAFAVGGMLQQQVTFLSSFTREKVLELNTNIHREMDDKFATVSKITDDQGAEILRIRNWKDEIEQTCPAIHARLEEQVNSLNARMERVIECQRTKGAIHE